MLAQYDGHGAFTRSYVYAGRERIGEQGGVAAASSWRHVDPITGDELQTNSNGGLTARATFDPQGVEVGDVDPFPADGSGGGELEPPNDGLVGGSGRLFPVEGGGSRCVLDGIVIDCSFIRGEAVASAPEQTTRARYDAHGHVTGFDFFHAYADGRSGFLPQDAVYDGSGRWHIPTGAPDDYGRRRNVRTENGAYGFTQQLILQA